MQVENSQRDQQRDPLSEIVGSMDLTGSVFLEAEFTAPWAVSGNVREEDCRPYLPSPSQVIAYHFITQGEALLSLDPGEGYREHYRARQGDLILLPSNGLHVLASETGASPVDDAKLVLPAVRDGLPSIVHGGGGEVTRMLCGFIASNLGPISLFDGLPKLLVINVGSPDKQRWIEATMVMAARELRATGNGGSTLAPGLCRLLLMTALRAYLEQTPAPVGWLGGMSHPRISRALSRIHSDMASPLRVDDLAVEVGMSRSAFVEAFSDVVGVSPRKYLQLQRIEKAARLLRETDLTSAEIAYRVGYDAPEAFSRAFKRKKGTSPKGYRVACEVA